MQELKDQCLNERMLEETHIKADQLMCEMLIRFGFEAGVKIYQEIDKYYA